MGWITLEEKWPPQGLEVLLEISAHGFDEHNCHVMWDHAFEIGCWIVPEGETEGHWLIHTSDDMWDLTIHAWMPLPKHYQKQEVFTQEPDLMEHAFFEDDPEWLYKGDCKYEQMTIEEFLKGVNA